MHMYLQLRNTYTCWNYLTIRQYVKKDIYTKGFMCSTVYISDMGTLLFFFTFTFFLQLTLLETQGCKQPDVVQNFDEDKVRVIIFYNTCIIVIILNSMPF